MVVFAIVAFLIFVGVGDANAVTMPSNRNSAMETAPNKPLDEILAARTSTNFVPAKDVQRVRLALEKFYLSCGYFPDQLERLLDAQTAPQNCKTPLKEPALAATIANRDLISRLNYTPYGYDDYELSLRLVWTESR